MLRQVVLPVAIAVSGGPDSMALLHLVAGWLKTRAPGTIAFASGAAPVIALTVDHGLRSRSSDEAQWVAAEAKRLGIPHATLEWRGPKPASGIQETARRARYDLLLNYVGGEGLPRPREILLAHHQDDQAETLLMRLARGSGIDGLSGMRETEVRTWLRLGHPVEERHIILRRPLLDVPKDRLLATLEALGAQCLLDPSNEDARFERVRLRARRSELEVAGLVNVSLSTAARRLAAARAAIEESQHELARAVVRIEHGACATLDLAGLRAAPRELTLRVLQSVIAAFGGRAEPPRRPQLEDLVERLRTSGKLALTLAGAVVVCEQAAPTLRIYREPGRRGLAKRLLRPGEGIFWDRRFYASLSSFYGEAVEVRPLGLPTYRRLLKEVPALGELRLPRQAAATLPSFWSRDELIAVPQLGDLSPDLRGPKINNECAILADFAPQHIRAMLGSREAPAITLL